MFLTGNGDTLLSIFGGKKYGMTDEYDKVKFNRATLVFCVILFVMEIFMMVYGRRFPVFSLVSIAVTVADFIGYTVYLKKYARKS